MKDEEGPKNREIKDAGLLLKITDAMKRKLKVPNSEPADTNAKQAVRKKLAEKKKP